jgi:hypothetical protein
MTVKVTLTGGGTDQYMRFGDAYVKNHDGSLDVVRTGAKEAHSYASGEWTDVEGDQKRFTKRFWR